MDLIAIRLPQKYFCGTCFLIQNNGWQPFGRLRTLWPHLGLEMANSVSTGMTTEVKNIFTDYLEKKELRKTSERYAILEEIYAYNGHFDVEALYQQMKEQQIPVSRATVYNTLDLLVECGLVSKHQFGQNQALYEKSHGSRQHNHLICTDCQKVIEFCDPRIHNVEKSVEELLQFKVLNHSLLLYGTCQKPNCENRKK